MELKKLFKILKTNGGSSDDCLSDFRGWLIEQGQSIYKNAIKLYNEVRLHLSLDFKTPNMVYKLTA